MDAFKVPEIVRMDMGGNDNWKRFFDGHEITKMEGRTFEDCTIGDRYSEGVGEEWKERLTAKVEGREYVPGPKKSTASVGPKPTSNTPVAKRQGISSSATPSRSSSPASSIGGTGPSSRKAQNETYFAKLGNENASRSANLPPSQGGKYAGFGSEPPTTARKADAGEALPGVDEFQKDPMAALTKGFGWFTTTVGKGAKTVNDSYIQPTAQKVYPIISHVFLNPHVDMTASLLKPTSQLKPV